MELPVHKIAAKGDDVMPLRTLPEQAFRRRARMVAVVFCAVCLGLAARLFYLQLRTIRWYTVSRTNRSVCRRSRPYRAIGASLSV